MLDDIYLHPEKLYSKAELEERRKELNKFRREAIQKIGDALHPNIRVAFSEN
jgi:hypothetical protein